MVLLKWTKRPSSIWRLEVVSLLLCFVAGLYYNCQFRLEGGWKRVECGSVFGPPFPDGFGGNAGPAVLTAFAILALLGCPLALLYPSLT